MGKRGFKPGEQADIDINQKRMRKANKRRIEQAIASIASGFRTCARCKAVKALEFFSTTGMAKYGNYIRYSSYCKVCAAAKSRQDRIDRRERVLEIQRASKDRCRKTPKTMTRVRENDVHIGSMSLQNKIVMALRHLEDGIHPATIAVKFQLTEAQVQEIASFAIKKG